MKRSFAAPLARGAARAACAAHRWRHLPRLLAALVWWTTAAPVRAEITGDVFTSSTWRATITAPKNWQLSERSSYPNILVWMVRRNPDGRMLLSAEELMPGEDALSYASRTAKLLQTMRFQTRAPQLHAASGAYWIDLDNGQRYLRQAFLVIGGTGYSLTLSASDPRTRGQHLRAFDFALRSLRAHQPVPDEGETAPAETGAPR
jgi:hypothetical protein